MLACLTLSPSAWALDPLPREAVPAPLKSWLPWTMQGHESLACPLSPTTGEARACAWPSELILDLDNKGGRFDYRVAIFTPGVWLRLPGDRENWPLELHLGERPLPVIEREGVPQVRLPAGTHHLNGVFVWREPPQNLKLPPEAGLIQVRLNGKTLHTPPDREGRLWLRQEAAPESPDTLSLQVFRLIDDTIPMTVLTQFDLVAAGKMREATLPLALLPGFEALSLDSPLPARLGNDGQLRVQLRPGHWRIAIGARRMSPVSELSLPAEIGREEEVWAFNAHHDLRLVALEGGQSIDPKQTAMPETWQGLPALRLTPGETLRLKESRRDTSAADDGVPDKLTLQRQAWLDFSGAGYTFHDRIGGEITRSWRLEAEPRVELGRVSVDGQDQPITRLHKTGSHGIELRHGRATIQADSRLTGEIGRLPATSWHADFAQVQTTLHLPPGWRLLHASGVDRVQGSWIGQWDLWAFFFVLLCVLATAKLCGIVPAVACALALTLSWHLEDAPHLLWPAALALLALERVLPTGRLRSLALWLKRAMLSAIALLLLALALTLVRQSLYPALESPSGAHSRTAASLPAPPVAKFDELPEAAPSAATGQDKKSAARQAQEETNTALSRSSPAAPAPRDKLANVDPGTRVQTGPGLPNWQWRQHVLSWNGPVERGQSIDLWLSPPKTTAAIHLLTLLTLAYLLWTLTGQPPGIRRLVGGTKTATLTALLTGLVLISVPDNAQAATPPEEARPSSTVTLPDEKWLQALRERLYPPPDCLPNCADLARLHLMADASSLQLRLQVHTQADIALPLPGDQAQFPAEQLRVDDQPALLRRDEQGRLWIALRAGVHEITMRLPVANDTVQIALPMTPRHFSAQLDGWTLGGLDAHGQAGEALSLTRELPKRTAARPGDSQTLPPFVRIMRRLNLAERWLMVTEIIREGPSPLPLEVRIPLLAGESVTDAEVRVEENTAGRFAVITLGQGQAIRRVQSSVTEATTLDFKAGLAPHQIESWRIDADARWHFSHSGLVPVSLSDEEGRLAPTWRPWPGEAMQLTIARPTGVEGQTLTVDALELSIRPGQRATDVLVRTTLRSSQGRNHVVELPEGAQLHSATIDGRTLPLRAEGRALTLPIAPGEHRVALEWREARGMGLTFTSSDFRINAAGANASIELQVPGDRIVLALRGPMLGPAVLFWGVLIVMLAGALLLARLRLAPLSFTAWALLGIGLLSSSVASLAIAVAWFAALGARQRYAEQLRGGWFRLTQIGLVILSFFAASALLEAIHTGLLGYPDLMIEGNGSSATQLFWFADRLTDAAPTVQVFSLPLWVFRLAMLLWALWLAHALLAWVKWGWSAFSTGGYWPSPLENSATGEKRGWFGRRTGKEMLAKNQAQTPRNEAAP